MKLFSTIATLACAIFISPSFFADAQSKQPEAKPSVPHDSQRKVVRVQVEFIEVSHETLTDLLSGKNKPQDDAALREHMTQLIKHGKASVFETLLASGLSGSESVYGSGLELIFPTEFEPAQISGNPGFVSSGMQEAPKHGKDVTGPSPMGFETRELGSRMECTATIQPNLVEIELMIAPQIISHVGFKAYSEWKGKYDQTQIKMPNIYAIRFQSNVIAPTGKPIFLTALSPKDEEGKMDTTRKLMVFVKAEILP